MNGVGKAVLNPANRRANVGFGYKGVSPLEYAQTQCGVLTEYLKLSIWPRPLCLDYTWPTANTAGDYVPTGLAIIFVLGLTIWWLVYRRALGFACAWVFIILAPTSSIVPIKDAMFEHRMYLPLAGVLVIGILGLVAVLRWLAAALSIGGMEGTRACAASSVLSRVASWSSRAGNMAPRGLKIGCSQNPCGNSLRKAWLASVSLRMMRLP